TWELVIEAPHALVKFLAYKGTVALNSVSLTENRVHEEKSCCLISINLIPHTLEATTLKNLTAGSAVNLEIDLIARYVERMLSAGAGTAE
ncbi:MAG: riboflavin synthase, partial [Oxalobacter sp.]|nr:riboflavin synthase [Oxalobacter sp.]